MKYCRYRKITLGRLEDGDGVSLHTNYVRTFLGSIRSGGSEIWFWKVRISNYHTLNSMLQNLKSGSKQFCLWEHVRGIWILVIWNMNQRTVWWFKGFEIVSLRFHIFKAKLQAESSVNWFPKKLISQIFKAFCLGDNEISFDIN